MNFRHTYYVVPTFYFISDILLKQKFHNPPPGLGINPAFVHDKQQYCP